MSSRAEAIKHTLLSTPFLSSRFDIIKTVGVGAAGVVFHVRDRKTNQDLALKVLADSEAFDKNTLKRFFRELQILREIRHPNLIQAYDFIAAEQVDAFTMELVKGTDLGSMVRKRKLQHEEIDYIFTSVLGALQELHNNGIAHRDLKLENILVGDDGTVKLTDLGIVKQLSDRGSTQTGLLLGTTQYLPPEYVKYNQYHLVGDIYAIGLMLHECLAGRRWLESRDTSEALKLISDKDFEFPRLALTGLPWKYQNILEKALAVEPENRFASATEMAAAFRSQTGNPHIRQSVEVRESLDLASIASVPLEMEAEARRTRRRRSLIFVTLCTLGIIATVALVVTLGPKAAQEARSAETAAGTAIAAPPAVIKSAPPAAEVKAESPPRPKGKKR